MSKKSEQRVVTLDPYEQGMVIFALNEARNEMLADKKPTDFVDDVLIKVIDAPNAKNRDRDRDRDDER